MTCTRSDLYEIDFALWTEQQADLLRRRAAGGLVNEAALDWQHLAEEIEAIGSNTRRELRNRLTRLLQHLLKWHYQPELRSRSWRLIIRTQCREIQDSAGGESRFARQAAGPVSGSLPARQD